MHTSTFQMFSTGNVSAFCKPQLGNGPIVGQPIASIWALLETMPAIWGCIDG